MKNDEAIYLVERLKTFCADMQRLVDDDYFLELMNAVERGEMSDASANQAYYEYINKQAEESDTPQTECDTCKYGKDKHRYAHICNECGVGINNYTPQTDCPWHDDNAMCNRCGETDCPWK